MYSIIYQSTAKPNFKTTSVFKMLLKAKKYNREHGITGCIIFYNGTFLQLLEGEEPAVRTVFEKIKADQRHHEVETLIGEQGDGRLWDDWSMAFYDLSGGRKSISQKRKLLEIYFNSADTGTGSDQVFDTFRNAAIALLQE